MEARFPYFTGRGVDPLSHTYRTTRKNTILNNTTQKTLKINQSVSKKNKNV